MTNEELLEEAKRRYPIGTEFISALKYYPDPAKCIVTGYSVDKVQGRTIVWGGKQGFLYDDGKWAEIVSKPKPQFEVGKWYKYTAGYLQPNAYYAKAGIQTNVNTFEYTEIIKPSKYSKILEYEKICSWSVIKVNPVLLTDLSEIQQYLPDGHPDKFVNHDFKVGDCFTSLENDIECSGCKTDTVYQIVEVNKDGVIYFMVSGCRMGISKKHHYLLKKGRSIYNETISLVEAMVPLQDEYNLASFKIEQELNNNNLKTNNNEETTTRNTTSVKVQRLNIKIGAANPVRGNGLDCTRSKIQLGSNYSYNQKRFSSCKSRVS